MPAGLATMADQTPAGRRAGAAPRVGAPPAPSCNGSRARGRPSADWDQRTPASAGRSHRLAVAVERRDVGQASRAALAAQQRTLEPRGELPPGRRGRRTERFRLVASRLELDVEAGDLDAVRGDVVALAGLRDRISGITPRGAVDRGSTRRSRC